MRRIFFYLIFILVLALSAADGYCNNISISNGSLTGQDDTADTIKIRFDIDWDNSWRDSTNFDAAWIFAKFSTDAGSTWSHATLKTSGTNPAGFSAGSGTAVDIVVPVDKVGAFIQRSDYASGSLSVTDVELVWDYGADGVSDDDVDTPETLIRIYGVEMVYVAEGSFLVGDADADQTACIKAGKNKSLPTSINSEGAITFNDSNDGPYYYQANANPGEYVSGTTFTISSSYPKGYGAFYLMKYEVSQGQWIDFFNTLTGTQKTTRDITSSSANGKNSDAVVKRNAVSWAGSDSAALVNGREGDRACNFLSWTDLAAFADWAGLRPMTELEFEKACRGPGTAVDDEYPWANHTIVAAGTLSGTEDGTETITTVGANACYNDTTFNGGDNGKGPLRCGIFAKAATDRASSGAGYYGAMELSGNVWERCVTIGNDDGLNFAASHGDGLLTDSGNATNTDWPGIDATPANGVTGAAGSGFRGGGWYESSTAGLEVADRRWAAREDSNRSDSSINYWGYGGRCARTAP